MKTTLIVIESEADLAEARALVAQLMQSAAQDPAAAARLQAQARLIEAWEERRWPRRTARPAEILRYLMDQHGLTRADLVPLLGTPSRVSEILNGKKPLSMAMIQRLRARFGIPADLLLPPPGDDARAA